MSVDIILQVIDLAKTYNLYSSNVDRLKESLHPLRKRYHHVFHALNNISFEIRKGESFGIIGQNGAGKSTLLKIISGVLTQTSGTVVVNGRVSALLELGGGFNPELTGIENIFFNGTLTGLSREEIENKLDEVLSFADIGEYVNQPVKMYSSGMFVRLAFAVSTMVDPQILILDEALAVGDVFFQQKCYKRLEQLQKKGVAIVVVSHGMSDIMQYCQRALVLDKGELAFCGDAREAVKKFFLLQQQAAVPDSASANEKPIEAFTELQQASYFWPQQGAFLDVSKALITSETHVSCTSVAICDVDGISCHTFLPGDVAVFYFEFQCNTDIEIPVGGVIICNNRNIIVHGRNTLECSTEAPSFVRNGSRVRFRQSVKLDIGPGDYTFNVGLSSLARTAAAHRGEIAHAQILQQLKRLCHVDRVGSFCVASFPTYFSSERYHHGICNLSGDAEVYVEINNQKTGEH